MMERKYLRKNQTLLLCEKEHGGFKRKFTIAKMISGKGASVVCYEAFHENSGKGVLKEFYPSDAYGLERDRSGQLIHREEFRDAYERFRRAETEYTEPYKMLLDVKQSSDDVELSTFIPSFEIYYGCDEEGNRIGTVYIWTPNPELETFDKICDEIHRHPNKNPEKKLVTVLTAMESLTKCICTLHSAGMIHRDINPSNFGFVRRSGETLTQTLSLFDINSICSVYGKIETIVGTEGYIEPEARYEEANNQTDLYSIGATLFHAVIVSEEAKKNGYHYRKEDYDRISQLVDESALIAASEANSHPRLRNVLSGILKRCLCERANRYANCEELLEDLETALYYALPSEVARKCRSGEKWILADVEAALDKNQEKNSLLTIQYHLYEQPLYQYSMEDTIHVLVLGFGNYGQKFLDACLQDGQMIGKKLNVTVVSEEETDKECYLSDRPELSEFFNIDGSLPDCEDTYGDVTFERRKLYRENPEANAEILQNILCEHSERKCPNYVFVALGEDRLNLSAAAACRDAAEVLEMRCAVSYVQEGKAEVKQESEGMYPLYINEDITQHPLYPEMERMAFNTHLIWEKSLNINYKAIRANFRKRYNHDACVANVLALKYKLYSLGIDLDLVGAEEAARVFRALLSDKHNRGIKNELIWIEHRRWVTEKLCLGWRKLRNLEECADGMTKDEKRKRHICIVRSRPDQKLATDYTKNDSFEKWDQAEETELDRLDELDRMSVELHRMYKKKAESLKTQNVLHGNSVAGIRMLIKEHKKAVVTFQEWYTCMKNIWNGERGSIPLYKGLKIAFLEAVKELSKEREKAVKEQVKALEAMFYPILASMEYRDWKQDDVVLIENIPFVLTYTEKAYLVIPFASGSNNEVFQNVASASMVSPERILYLSMIKTRSELEKWKDAVSYVLEYMKKKQMKTAVEFVWIYKEEMTPYLSKNLEKEILVSGEGRIRQIRRIVWEKNEEISAGLEQYLKKRSSKKQLFALEKNETKLSYLLQGAGIYRTFACYRFDSDTMKFFDISGCDMLRYIRKTSYITVTDMAAFRLSASKSSNQPEFYQDYKSLWGKYCEQNGTWKQLCDILGEYALEHDVLVSMKKKTEREKNTETREYRYILPFACSQSVEKIIRFLREYDVLEDGSCVNGYTTDSCEVILYDRCGYRTVYNRLLSNVYALMQADSIDLQLKTKTHEIRIYFDDLFVRGVAVTGNKTEEMERLMRFFQEKGYVINLMILPDGKWSFTYATRPIKELLTTAGKMLEIYTYHKAKELGRFDDVVSSFEIDWEETDVKNEFDCILTRGFRTLFVECKARSDIQQEFYFKLASLAEQFGINATAVLIADTREKSFYDNAAVNAMQRKRGNMMNVVTIWKPEEINNIGHILLKVINGTYVSEEE